MAKKSRLITAAAADSGRAPIVPIARLDVDAPRSVAEALLLRAGGFAMTTREVVQHGNTGSAWRIPSGEMVGVFSVSPGTPPRRMCGIVWIHPNETDQAQAIVPETWLRPVTQIVLGSDMLA